MATKAPAIGTRVSGYDGTGPDRFQGTVTEHAARDVVYVEYSYVSESMFRHVRGGWHTPAELLDFIPDDNLRDAWQPLP